MVFKITRSTKEATRRKQSGALLMEYLVSMFLGTLLVTVLTGLTYYSGRSFVAIANYLDLNQRGARAMDSLTRDIRGCSALTSYTANQLVFNDGTSPTGLSYTYDPNKRTLVREQGGSASTLLTECDSVQFSIFQRTPLTGTYDQYPTAVATNCKVVSVKWTCSRTIFGIQCTTETDEEAKVVIRKR